MRLKSIKIHNFRGILDQEIFFRDYSLLVGANNSGKSTVIDTIRAFYEKDGFKFLEERDFPYIETEDKESWVELAFVLADEEYDSLEDVYKSESKELKVRKYFKTEGKLKVGFVFGYKSNGELNDEPFYGAKSVQSGKFGDLIYIPAISKVDEHTKLSGPSALRDLLYDILSDVVQGGRSYRSFSGAVEDFSNAVRKEQTSDGRSLADFEEKLNHLLRSWQASFKMHFKPPSAPDLIKSLLSWEIVDQTHNKSQDVELYGSGFQRYFIYALVQIASQYTGRKPTKKEKDFAPSLVMVLFEEPEAFLHPPQQERLAQNLRALATKGWQVICATHSPYFVSRNTADIPSIIRLQRENGRVQGFQVSEDIWRGIVDWNQQINAIAQKYPNLAKKLSEDDRKPDMEAIKYFIWLNPDRAGIFFAEHVLLVEGPTEVALINRLISDNRFSTVPAGLYIVDCTGKYNIHRFMNLLKCLGIRHSVIHDGDEDKGQHHKEVNRLIQESADKHLTLSIKCIPNDLETMLGLPSPGSEHRKPQHVLFLYETGGIDIEKLDAFCKMVEECLPPSAGVSSKKDAETQ
jgi:predicted ATP-dependent endonuclease of OLD family